MPLNDTMLRNLKSDGTPKKLADSEGLYLYLSASGGKLWRMDYRFGGKRKTLSFGAYPAGSLKEARRKRDKARNCSPTTLTPARRRKPPGKKRKLPRGNRRHRLSLWPGSGSPAIFHWAGGRGRSSAATGRRDRQMRAFSRKAMDKAGKNIWCPHFWKFLLYKMVYRDPFSAVFGSRR